MKDATDLPNLPQLEWVQTLRDPIWGEIPITEVEKQIIQTEAFYRLRGIKQLGFAYLAFPGAVHSRFEHSIGVMHATNVLLEMVKRSDVDAGIKIDAFGRQLLRIAALLHDIGHPPFSHAMEKLFTFYPKLLKKDLKNYSKIFNGLPVEQIIPKIKRGRHEFFTEWIICNDKDIIQVLTDWLSRERSNVVQRKNIKNDARSWIDEVIAPLAVGGAIELNNIPENQFELFSLFKSIMSGDLDADKIDYIRRDNYYCGLLQGLDLTTLRNQLVPQDGGLQIESAAKCFVHSITLARYRLVTEVHQEKWDAFATSKAIELLYNRLLNCKGLAEKIKLIFTKWNDSKLLDFLLKTEDSIIKDVLKTQYPLKELTRLEFLETHPYIRECIQVLSEPVNHSQIIELQNDLREALDNEKLFVNIHTGKSPQYSTRVVGGGNLLRDEILRGISEESIKNLYLVVYGPEQIEVNLKKINPEFLPCRECPVNENCTGNLRDPLKILIAQLATRRYRKISQKCKSNKIIAADFLLLIMEKINQMKEAEKIKEPIRQDIYLVAKLVHDSLRGNPAILGSLDLSSPEITISFHHELRKYEQLGLIAYSREIKQLHSEEDPQIDVFRYDRRFKLSRFGELRLKKVRELQKSGINDYEEYIKSWEKVEKILKDHEDTIEALLKENPAQEKEPEIF